MTKQSILPADTYIVMNKTILQEQDQFLLTTLYQPIIGSIAVSLYLNLWTTLNQQAILSEEHTHHHLVRNMQLSLTSLVEARERLEAIGLLKTYLKKGDINHYVYQLYSPISSFDFFSNPILNTALYHHVGKVSYQRIVALFKIPKVNLQQYEEISCSFTDVFESSSTAPSEEMLADLRKKDTQSLKIASSIDLDNVLSMIPEEMVSIRQITKTTKDLLYKLSFIYNLNEEQIGTIIRNSVNEKHGLDKELLKTNTRNYYQFEHQGKLPSLVYRNQPEYLRKPIGDGSKRAKMIYSFETITPYDFLCSKYQGSRPTKTDLKLLEYLAVDLNLKPGVINVLVDYILRINQNKLTRAFVETVAGQWKRQKIETVEEAMALAEKEYKSRKQKTINKSNKEVVPKKPEWFDQQIEVISASSEEESEIESLLSQYK